MVVPCLTCIKRTGVKYEINPQTQLYEYHVECSVRNDLPNPVPKEDFECAEYTKKPKALRVERKQCDVEVNH